MQTKIAQCPGPVTWFVVPAEDDYPEPAALVLCERCGDVIDPHHITAEHRDVVVVIHEDDYPRRHG